jgi:hypothetical protein
MLSTELSNPLVLLQGKSAGELNLLTFFVPPGLTGLPGLPGSRFSMPFLGKEMERLRRLASLRIMSLEAPWRFWLKESRLLVLNLMGETTELRETMVVVTWSLGERGERGSA